MEVIYPLRIRKEIIYLKTLSGNYFLEIDRSTTEINDIPTQTFPAALSLINKENTFNFGLTTAANVQGHVKFLETGEKDQPDFDQIQSEKGKKKKKSIIVEATNNDQTYRKDLSHWRKLRLYLS